MKIITSKEYDVKITLMEKTNIFKVERYSRKITTDLAKRFNSINNSDDNYQANKKQTMKKCARKIIELVECNAGAFKKENGRSFPPIFLTLTFKENIQNFDYANTEHMKFIKRLNYRIYGEKCSKLAYISVPELQTRGAIHYHILFFNLPYIDKKEIEDIWGHGFTRIETERVKGMKGTNLGAYITKYMIKQFCSDGTFDTFYYNKELWEGKKTYFTSRALYRPMVARIGLSDMPHVDWLLDNETPIDTYERTYTEEYTGEQILNSTITVYKIDNEKIKYFKNLIPNLKQVEYKTKFYLSKKPSNTFLHIGKTIPVIDSMWKDIKCKTERVFIDIDYMESPF